MSANGYRAAAIFGFFIPPVLVGYYVAENGFDLVDILNAMVDNTIALAVFLDLTFACLVFFVWARKEAVLHGIERWWLCIPATVIIGLCFGLPLFLYWRERAIEEAAGQSLAAAQS